MIWYDEKDNNLLGQIGLKIDTGWSVMALRQDKARSSNLGRMPAKSFIFFPVWLLMAKTRDIRCNTNKWKVEDWDVMYYCNKSYQETAIDTLHFFLICHV